VQEALAHGWYRPSVSYWPDVEEALNEVVRRVLQGGEDAKTVLDDLHGTIEQAAQAAGEPYPPESS
jgi:hypothetical protein